MRHLPRPDRSHCPAENPRRGNIIVLSAFVIVLLLAFTAFSVDVGYIALSKSQLQSAADAAALAAAMELNPIEDQSVVEENVKQAALEVAAANSGGGQSSVIINPDTDVVLGRRTWNPSTQTYTTTWGPTATPYNVVKVFVRRNENQVLQTGGGVQDNSLPLFFAPVIGHEKANIEVSAIATFQPRDMVLVLDYSASMNDDSELRSIYTLGQSAVEDMIYQMWEDLGSPTYGNMGFWPDWVTIPDSFADVTWKSTSVDVAAHTTLQSVKLYFGSSSQTFNTSSGGTFAGTGSYSGRLITKVKIKASNTWHTIDFYDKNTLKQGLGLDTVSYPYPSGSWDDYIDYCIDSGGWSWWYDYYVYAAGYRRKFGMLTLINFWNKNKPKYSETPDLWKASQQPITALKDAVDVLVDYLTDVEAEDQIGLAVYTYPSSDGALLESGLTSDYEQIKTISRQRQAGHYDYYTNIGAGIRIGRLELENNARPKAFRMMVLMTDGLANRTLTSASPTQFALDEADLCAESKIRIMTISLGAEADTELMQEIADRTGGIHFNVPGGSSVADYEQQLKDVFAEIAADRPLKLIRIDE